ncbi:MAG: acetyl/propionyl/methylcrotonyl-CoA carboxylase subunit alpha [Neomegalonema sp.]|nr:acetyl/propionyl/methylcrotonyl-CoA carboxylase subunit alpha [Neomegalonema sp.]
MFNKILIANRGEIACRVMRTAHRLGVSCVAVYSEADAQALHVAMADEAVCIGPAPVAQSYLQGGAIIDAALRTGAQAIHPGYGFLSENPGFIDAVTAAGLRFIGPSAAAVRAMGLKDAAKALMEKAGVPVVPGYHGARQEPEFLAQEAARIGYPVLLKARAGGGGKGMRKIERPEDFADALAGAQREGLASFGDGQVLLEKWVSTPRHIEVQVFGDDHGSVVHLFERDCSLQRRHQKVIEEAPAPGMTEEMRAAMGEAAVRAAQAVGYSGAGTVEFIVDASEGLRADRFYFMEMNTRLQVEHPVTEAITGLDLVEWQLRVASGEALPMAQEDLSINGWAFEARLYAEDAAKGFLPATGPLHALSFPERGARIDSGVRQGDVISPHYDPMIAKIITHGPTRGAALGALRRALAETEVAGTITNRDFLGSLAAHEGFAAGAVDTGLIERDLAQLVPEPATPMGLAGLAALYALGLLERYAERPAARDPFAALGALRLWGAGESFADLIVDEQPLTLRLTPVGEGAWRVSDGDTKADIRLLGRDGPRWRALIDGQVQTAFLSRLREIVSLSTAQQSIRIALQDPFLRPEEVSGGGDRVLSPMPGLVKLVSVEPGQTVSRGQPLIVLEAMKMEHTLSAPRDGAVGELLVAVGDQVEEGVLLLALAQGE